METTFSVEAIVKTGNMNAKLILLAEKKFKSSIQGKKTTNSISLKKPEKNKICFILQSKEKEINQT